MLQCCINMIQCRIKTHVKKQVKWPLEAQSSTYAPRLSIPSYIFAKCRTATPVIHQPNLGILCTTSFSHPPSTPTCDQRFSIRPTFTYLEKRFDRLKVVNIYIYKFSNLKNNHAFIFIYWYISQRTKRGILFRRNNDSTYIFGLA